MNFKRVPTILSADELTELAFSRASKEGRAVPRRGVSGYLRAKRSEGKRVRVASSTVVKKFSRILNTFNLDGLSPFYYELIDVSIGIDKLKTARGTLSWASNTIEKYEQTYRYKIRVAKKDAEIYKYRREFYGKLASVLKKIGNQLEFLASAREKLKNLPSFEDTFTIVISGPPNVGKSMFLRAMTGARPKVDVYPFTTKQILVGYFERRHVRYQVVDTPGLLDRRLEDRNPIERQAIMALQHLANVVIFIFDPTETCGFPMEEQKKIYDDIKGAFDLPVVPVLNKSDLFDANIKDIPTDGYICSAKAGTGVEEVVEMIVKSSR
ncbi:MAG: GTPase [Candidatus Hydrothermarchaeaceae archaeon]